MPRTAGTYSLPAGNPVVTGTVISSTVQNNTMNDVATALTDSLPRDGTAPPSANIPMNSFKFTGAGNAASSGDFLAYGQAPLNGFSYVASAATTDIGAVENTYQLITGTTTITSFGTKAAGVWKFLTFQGILTLTHNATSLIIPAGQSITTAAGDSCIAMSLGSGNWRIVSFTRANGQQIAIVATFPDGTVGAPGIAFTSDTNTGLYLIGADNIGIATNGAQRASIAQAAFIVTSPFQTGNGSAGAPSHSFSGDPDTGLYSSGTNAIGVATGGAQIANFGTNGFNVDGQVSTDGLEAVVAGATAVAGQFQATNASYTGNIVNVVSTRLASTAFDMFECAANGGADPVFRVRGDGQVFTDGTTTMTNPADYAEMFEWDDGNPDAEDRVGLCVSLVGAKIKAAQPGDEIIGVVSGNPAVLADGGAHWVGMYLHDDYNRPAFTEEGNRSVNPAYDPELVYVPRIERKEWSPIGLVGKLRVKEGQPVNPRWILLRQVSDGVLEYLVR